MNRRNLALVIVVVAPFYFCLGVSAEELVGGQSWGAGERAKSHDVFHYQYYRTGSHVRVEAFDAHGKNTLTLSLDWPENQGVLIGYTDNNGRDIGINWQEEQGVFTFEDRQISERATMAFGQEGSWLASEDSTVAAPMRLIGSNSQLIKKIVFIYEDTLINLGLREIRNRMIREQVENQKRNSESEFVPDSLTLKIPCGVPLCNGPTFVETATGLTAQSCCNNAATASNSWCAGFGGCIFCCKYACASACLIDGVICSCTGAGTACGTEVPCEPDDWPPPCT